LRAAKRAAKNCAPAWRVAEGREKERASFLNRRIARAPRDDEFLKQI
jgi:hypothetical protein